MRRCGVPPPPPPIIFERLKLPQQIIYRRKENLSESPNHKKYWENILVSRFYEQFSRNRRNLGHFRKFEKISNSQNMNILYINLKRVIWRFQIYNLFREKFKFRGFTKAFTNFAKYIIAFIFAKFKYFAKQIISLESPDHPLQNDIYICSYSESLKFFRTSENGLNSAYFAKIAHKIAKPKYFPNIFDDSDSPINSLSDDI